MASGSSSVAGYVHLSDKVALQHAEKIVNIKIRMSVEQLAAIFVRELHAHLVSEKGNYLLGQLITLDYLFSKGKHQMALGHRSSLCIV